MNNNRKILILIFCLAGVSILWYLINQIPSVRENAAISIATHLLSNPQPTPGFVWKDTYPKAGSVIKSSDEICITILPVALTRPSDPDPEDHFIPAIADKTVIRINGQEVPREKVRYSILNGIYPLPDGRWSGILPFCTEPILKNGVTLFEFATVNPFDSNQKFFYSWAYTVK